MAKPLILYDNRYLDGTITTPIGGTATGYSLSNIIDCRPFTWWKANASGMVLIHVDCGSPKYADALGVIGHNIHSAAGSIAVQCSANDADWDTPLNSFDPGHDRAFVRTFTGVTKRYWRLYLGSSSLPYQLAVVFLGARLDFERYLLKDFDPQPETIEASDSTGKTGNLLGVNVDYISRPLTANWKNLTPSWVANYFRPAWDNYLSLCKPFFWAWDIGNYQSEAYFCWIPPKFGLKMPYNPVRRTLSLTMKSIKEM